jgi:hypothetical protein
MDSKVGQTGHSTPDVYDRWVEKMQRAHAQEQTGSNNSQPNPPANRLGNILRVGTYSNYQNYRHRIIDLDQK